jgi:PQQ-dependent dehydrogenase (methanol/ethanol family)
MQQLVPNPQRNSRLRFLSFCSGFALCAVLFILIVLSRLHAAPQEQSISSKPSNDRSSAALISASPAFSAQDLAAPPVQNWLKIGGSLSNQNWSPLKQIDRENVGALKAAWQTHLDGSALGMKYSGEAQPIVYEGVLYIVTGADDVFAIRLRSGEILWRYKANLDQSITTVCCGWTSRGLALGDGKIYLGRLDGRLIALDQKSGKPAWSIQAERWQEGYTITAAPLYYDGMIVVGFAGGENGTRGRLKAYDAKDGHLIWTFYTIPGPGEIGHDTWPKDSDAWKYGGASIWQTPAVDPELGLLYFTTGNPGPDFNGRIRPGDNLFANSMVAIDAKTGKYRWHFQQVHHDIWDYDGPNPVMLFDVNVGGRIRKAAAEASKTGWVYILDRTTGKPLIGIDEKPVAQEPRQFTSATQPFPRGNAFVPHSIDVAPEGFTLVNEGRIFTPFWAAGVIAKPAPRGGANWAPSSYDPNTNEYYVCAVDAPNYFKGGEEDEKFPNSGERYLGSAFGGMPIGANGIFAALDMKTNRLIWQQRWKDTCYSGSVATAGGIVFVGRNDGRFTALNSSTGQRLWEFQTGAGVNAPPSVFEYQGDEYVAVYSGGSLFAGTPRGDSIFLFSLKGALGPVSQLSSQSSSAPLGEHR